MGLLEKIRTRGNRYFLDKALKETNFLRQALNYSRAYSICILFDASDAGEVRLVNQYAQRLKTDGKKVELFGLFKNKKQVGENTFPYFTLSSVNVFHVPDKAVMEYANKPFDLLISLHNKSSLSLEYISALSKAKCRVGRYIKDKTWCYDVMVYMQEGQPLAEMVKQIDHLLTEINKYATV